jgi:hypothetical protein
VNREQERVQGAEIHLVPPVPRGNGVADRRTESRLTRATRWLIPLAALLVAVLLTEPLHRLSRPSLAVAVALVTIAVDRALAAGVRVAAAWRRKPPALPPRPALVPVPDYPQAPEQPVQQAPEQVPDQSSEQPPEQSPQQPRRDLMVVPSPIPDQRYRPLSFAGQTPIGSAPWRLPRIPAQSGVAADEAVAGDLVLRAASVIGAAHRFSAARAAPRQDSYRLGLDTNNRFLLVAVADGVSGASHSEWGARLATTLAVDRLRAVLEETQDLERIRSDQVFGAVARQMEDQARENRFKPGDCATTLITAVIPMTAKQSAPRRAWVGWLADSSAWLLGADGWRRLTGERGSGPGRATPDACLPGDPLFATHRMVELPADGALVLMTAGLGDLLTDVPDAADELAARWAAPPPLSEFLRDLCFDAPGQDDDRTAVMVWATGGGRRRGGPAVGSSAAASPAHRQLSLHSTISTSY